ncbi:MAG: response regulator transcription factor [Chitinophagaceae bacterium]
MLTTQDSRASSCIHVGITDDHVLYRSGVHAALRVKNDVQVVFEAENGLDLFSKLRRQKTDVVLLDIQMPFMDATNVLPLIRKEHPDIKVIILSMHDHPEIIMQLMELGANSFLTKKADSDTIHQAIKTVHEQGYYFNTHTNQAIINSIHAKNKMLQRHITGIRLRQNELAVLRLMCEEKSTKEIAKLIGLSHRSVESIRDRLKVKLGLKSIAGLVLYAVRNNILAN